MLIVVVEKKFNIIKNQFLYTIIKKFENIYIDNSYRKTKKKDKAIKVKQALCRIIKLVSIRKSILEVRN